MGGRINYDRPKLSFTKAASQELGGSVGPVEPGTCLVPLVNSDLQVVPLPLGEGDHACDMSGMGGAQSLVAVGSEDRMGNVRNMLTIMTKLNRELHSATIDNTANSVTPSNVFPLPMSDSDTPMLPITGVEYSQGSAATHESMIAVAFEILRQVDPTGRYVRHNNDIMEGTANVGTQIQVTKQQAHLQAAANAASQLGSDRSSDTDSSSATPPFFPLLRGVQCGAARLRQCWCEWQRGCQHGRAGRGTVGIAHRGS